MRQLVCTQVCAPSHAPDTGSCEPPYLLASTVLFWPLQQEPKGGVPVMSQQR